MRKLLIVALATTSLTALAAAPITVKRSLEKVPGVSAVKVDFNKKNATVTYDPDKTKPDVLTKATTNAGYPSTVRQ